MKTPEGWICDVCGSLIEKADDGWVEWIEYADDRTGRDMRLVHHVTASPALPEGCQFSGDRERRRDGGQVMDRALERVLTVDGLTYLLSFIAEERLPTDQVIEMIRRLHIPGYERARLSVDQAVSAGVIEPVMRPGCLTQDDIAAILKHREEVDRCL